MYIYCNMSNFTSKSIMVLKCSLSGGRNKDGMHKLHMGRHAGMRPSAASTALMTVRLLCTCSSKTSSVVNEWGAVDA